MVLVKQFPVPTEGIKLQSGNIEAFVDNDVHGKGNLFITEENISWINGDSGEGFKVAYKKMTLHAISRDPVVHSRACLYIMVNGNVLDEDGNFVVECPPDLDLDDGEEEMTEIRFVPDDISVLDEMYKAVQECSLLHPDPSSDLSSKMARVLQNHEDPDERFEGFIEGDEDAAAPEEEDEEIEENEEEVDEEAERLEQFLRMQLHFNSRNNGDSGNGDDDLGFIPEPGQFDDN